MSVDMSVDPTGPNLQLTPDEKRVYGQLFRQADTGGAGIVTGEVAVSFFDKTRLDSRVLGEIWQIADNDNRGYLTPVRFGIVLRLIGHAQAGREPTAVLALEPGPLPRFDGLGPLPPPQVASPPPPQALQAQASGGPIRIPPLTPEKVAQYASLFERQPLQNGTLPGDQAKQIFEKSGLPNEVLGRIWMLADTEQRGALVQAEFTIAMHLLTSMKTGSLRALPNLLPAPLYEAAMRRGSPSAPRQSPQNTAVSAVPRQMSGAGQRQGSPLGRSPIGLQATGQAVEWAVAPGDKVKFDQIFADLDKGNKGVITGEEAVPFFSQSNLPEDALAQIWDLADINSQGHLSRDEFAVAMFLIRQQRGTRSGGGLPTVLPANLIPPSLRNQSRPAASAFEPPPMTQAPPPQPKSALDDLFGLDSTSSSPAPVLPAQQTGGSNVNDPFAGGPSSPSMRPATATTFKPFVPSSSFGRGLAGPAGDSTPSSQQLTQHEDDLLGDNDETSKNLTGETTELANLSNQIGSLSKQMQDTQAKRSTTQNELNQTNSQKANFEQRLSQLRTLYEKEAADTRALEEQLRNARIETQKLQGDCMKLEVIYRDVQTQHHEVTVALQADQQENTNLRERIRVVNAEISQLKPQIDKLKSDARQQKGLVAINKKQFSTTEGERDKLKAEAEDLAKSNDDISRHVNTDSPSSPHAKLASPALSTASGNNPFFNRSASTDIMGTFASPPARNYSENTFDDVFGPSFPAGSRATPPPTSFKQQHTGTSVASGNSSIPRAASPNVSRQANLAAGEPPAPPESRQMNSSFLPFPEPTESMSSSRHVSPPASRAEGSGSEAQNPFPGEAGSAASVPGAFPGEDTDKNNISSATPAPADDGVKVPDGAATSSDPFANTDQAKAKAEFENAFAAFSSSNQGQDKSTSEAPKSRAAFDTEFPPISSLEREDYSDSDSEQGGFEDDFAPPPQQKTADQKATGAEGSKAEEMSSEAGPSVSSKDTLDKSEMSSSHATITDSHATTAPQKSTVDDFFGSSDTPPPTYQAAASKPAHKGAFDDLDDEFEGLEDAKEGSADDDFANISRSGLDDFNPVFDSSPPPSQAKSESTAFGNESSFDFISANSVSGGPAPASDNQQKGAESHDWDAIFAGLDAPGTTAAVPVANEPKGENIAPVERPIVERVQTEASTNDDPILKDLISMGYGRTAALNALEKYDYNLERAANHLASHS